MISRESQDSDFSCSLGQILEKSGILPDFEYCMEPHLGILREKSYQQEYPDIDHQTECKKLTSVSTKSLSILNEASIERSTSSDEYKEKTIADWSSDNVMYWLADIAESSGRSIEDFQLFQFKHINGYEMCRMNVEHLVNLVPLHGAFIFSEFQKLILSERLNTRFMTESGYSSANGEDNFTHLCTLEPMQANFGYNEYMPDDSLLYLNPVSLGTDHHQQLMETSEEVMNLLPTFEECLQQQQQTTPAPMISNNFSTMNLDLRQEKQTSQYSPQESEYKPINGINGLKLDPKVKRKVGRPKLPDHMRKRRAGKKYALIWEFIIDLLNDPETNPSVVKWENLNEGIFRFVQSDKVAEIWGSKKGKPDMSFEKFSRAIRYHYKNKVLLPIEKRLVYKFGPKSDWRPKIHFRN